MEREIEDPPGDSDDALVADLRRVLATVDPIPEHVRIAARLAIEWRTLEAELAELVHDSSVDEPLLALRGAATARALSFEVGELTIEVETEPLGDERGSMRIVGQLVPPTAAEVTIRNNDELFVAQADARGRFCAAGLLPGRLSLRCRLDDRLVETSWLTL